MVFCGSAVGAASARRGAPYAGPGNKFWPMLAETGVTPRRLAPEEYRELLGLGVGLTDLNKTESGADSDLTRGADDAAAVVDKIARYRPALWAFAAKRPAAVFLRYAFDQRSVAYGLQPQAIGATRLFVLPSPSGLAVRFWDPQPWHALAALYREARPR